MHLNMSPADADEIGLIFDPDDLPLDVAAEGRRVALAYSVVLDWSEELGFTGACVELPRLTARAVDATACVESLFDQAAAQVATILAHGLTPPSAVRSSATRKNRPASPGAAVPPSVSDAPTLLTVTDTDDDDLERPSLGQVRRMAQWTAYQYRIVMHYAHGSYYGISPEVPAASGFGRTPNGCVDDLRRQLVRHVTDLIIANQMPPEPIQDREGRPRQPKRAA
jgi:predicted RNase H-like HicB family nuclease